MRMLTSNSGSDLVGESDSITRAATYTAANLAQGLEGAVQRGTNVATGLACWPPSGPGCLGADERLDGRYRLPAREPRVVLVRPGHAAALCSPVSLPV